MDCIYWIFKKIITEHNSSHTEVYANVFSCKCLKKCDWSHDPNWHEQFNSCTHLPVYHTNHPLSSSLNVLLSLMCSHAANSLCVLVICDVNSYQVVYVEINLSLSTGSFIMNDVICALIKPSKFVWDNFSFLCLLNL